MTTIVAYAAAGEAWMAADTTTNVYDRPVVSATKILRVRTKDGHDVLMGFSGEGAGPAVIKAHLSIESLPCLDHRGECDDWANAIAAACEIGILLDRYSGGPVLLERLTS